MRSAAGFLLLSCWACGHAAKPATSFPLRGVCASEIAKLERARPEPAAAQEPSPDFREQVRSLVLERAHAIGKMRVLALEDLRTIGEAAVPIVDELLDEKGRDQDEQLSALEALGAIDAGSSADALVKRVHLEKYRDPWIRAQAAFQLTKLASDHVLPRLLMQLKYETDGETVVWIARTLANHRNFAGLDGLRVLADQGATPEVRSQAQQVLAAIAQEAGFPDSDALESAWSSPDPERKVPRAEPSPRLRLEMWRCISDLAEFDLRLVDDARFALSRSGPWVVELLVLALHDENAHLRVHVAQSLERMGPRASAACDELARALDERGTAAAAASALGSIRCPRALEALAARLGPRNDAELRAAAAAALGVLGDGKAIPPLRALLGKDEPLDLRQAAAQSLVALGEGGDAVLLLVGCLTEPGADAGGAEGALERWLVRQAAVRPDSSPVLERWTSLGGDPARTLPPAEAAERQRARAELLRGSLERIAPAAR